MIKDSCDKCGSRENIQFYGANKKLALCLTHDREWMLVMDKRKFVGSQWQKEYERQYWAFCGKPIARHERDITKIKKTLLSMPQSAEYKANRYDTDDEIVLSVWNEGQTFDIRIFK